MNKRAYKIGLIFCLLIFIALSGFVIYENHRQNLEEIPVVSIPEEEKQEPETTTEVTKKEVIQLPYSGDITIARTFYEQSDDETRQQNSLVYFEGVYRPNQGIDFTNENQTFDVLASLSGKVITKKDDPVFGLLVTIESDEGIKITYQSLSETSLNIDDEVKQGSVIGKSGENLYEADLGNHLHFIIEKNDQLLNPEKCFNKECSEI